MQWYNIYYSCDQSEGTTGRKTQGETNQYPWQWAHPTSQMRWVFLIKYNHENIFCCFIFSSLCRSVLTTDHKSHLMRKPWAVCCMPVWCCLPRGGRVHSITRAPLLCLYFTGFVSCLWALAKGRGDRSSQGSSSKVSADTQQSKSSPCITPEQHGGYTLLYPPQWHWLKGHVACNPDLFTVLCLSFRSGVVIKKLRKNKPTTFQKKTALLMLIRLICAAKHPQGTILPL